MFELAYQRYLDIEKAQAQAREAQIEASLERVRSRAMAMHKSDELQDVVNTVFEKLKDLKINMNVASIFIFKEGSKDWEQWVATSTTSYSTYFHIPYTDNLVFRDLEEAKQKRKDFYSVRYSFEQKNEWFNYAFENTEYRQVPDDRKKYILENKFFLLSFALSKHSGIQIAKYEGKDFSQEENEVLKRFSRVFEQAYTRFNDLKRAEAQAKEAQIELALERVRARTMAMQKSDELQEAAVLLFMQVKSLGVPAFSCGFNIWEKGDKTFHAFMTGYENTIEPAINLPFNEDPNFKRFDESKRKGEDFYVLEMRGEAMQKHYQYLKRTVPVFKEAFDKIQKAGLSLPETQIHHIANFSNGNLMFITLEPCPEAHEIFKRFAKVFEQTYTRFLDLQKAEAQAREAQIEAALEKVRSRSLAMHKSNELQEVVNAVFERLKALEINMNVASIFIFKEGSKDWQQWVATSTTNYSTYFQIPYVDLPVFRDLEVAKSKGKDFYSIRYSFEQKNEWFNYAFNNTEYRRIPSDRKKFLIESEFFQVSFALAKNTGIQIAIYSGKEFSETDNEILKRFSRVFEQTYIRFLDLQKAEAQAREAQIEASLERVRSRTMAMHKSEELSETASVLFKQLNELGNKPERMNICIVNEDTGLLEVWSTEQGGSQINHSFNARLDEPTTLAKVYTGWKDKIKSMTVELSGKALVDWIHFVQKEMNMPLKEEMVNGKRAHSVAYFSHGFLLMTTPESLPQKTISLLERFAAVFNLTYRRFLDLQKAEAQAREAQIEAALERVRSRTMAMQRSEELSETSFVLFQQFAELGIIPNRFFIGIVNEDEGIFDLWITEWGGTMYSQTFKGNLDEPLMWKKVYEAWKRKDKAIVIDINGDDLVKWNEYLKGIDFPVASRRFVSRVVNSCAIFSKGCISITTPEIMSTETVRLLERFASVFDGTYTRFIDLKNAEAQAREAQVEVALERVRSRTMAMQHSDELAETAAEVFKQLINLGIEPNRIYIAIIKNDSGIGEFWITDEDGTKVSTGFTANFNDNGSFKKMFEGWKEQKKSITIDMQGQELEEYFKHLSKLNVPFKGGLSQKRRIQNIAYFSKGFIGVASPDETKPETIQLLERFAAVFNLTYTRFHDLKNAEAQNKIIQADNDRKSKELEEARKLQLSMLPKELPKLPFLDIAVYMKTATEVGGDYYDFIVDKDGTLTFVVGDATGHGMMSGMMVSIMKSFFISYKKNIELKQFFETTNNSIKDMQLGRLMMAFMGVQITSKKVIATNAGMPSLIYFRNKSQKAGEFVSHNMPLGAMKGTKYSLKEINYERGDTLLLMSDGFAELKNANNEQYGYPRIINKFKSVAQKSVNEIVEHLKDSASQWINGIEPDDDVTFVVIKVK